MSRAVDLSPPEPWEPRIGPCKTCRFREGEECRRHPPVWNREEIVPRAYPGRVNPGHEEYVVVRTPVFPLALEGCGEYRP